MIRLAAAVLLILPLLLACGDSSTGPGQIEEITELPRELSVSEREIIRSSNSFAFNLAGQVSHPDSSFFISPFSASMALGMTMNGADGETLRQMRDVLGFGELPEEEINGSYRSLIDLLTGLDPTVEMAIANAVWLREGFDVKDPFRARVREFFDARVESLDFGAPSALETINAWVRNGTNGRIEEMLERIPPNVVAYLMNTTYFQGMWRHKFDSERTEPAPFHLPDGSTVEVPMMEARDVHGRFGGTKEYRVVELPYGGDAFAMTIVLPSGEMSVDALLDQLDAETWSAVMEGLRDQKFTIFFPRFEMAYGRTLNSDLKALGMLDLFDPGAADLSRLAGGGLWVGEVKQKAFVRVDEEGTEAAASTSVSVRVSGPLIVRVDRPFLFAIRKRLSGAILFMGAVVETPGA